MPPTLKDLLNETPGHLRPVFSAAFEATPLDDLDMFLQDWARYVTVLQELPDVPFEVIRARMILDRLMYELDIIDRASQRLWAVHEHYFTGSETAARKVTDLLRQQAEEAVDTAANDVDRAANEAGLARDALDKINVLLGL